MLMFSSASTSKIPTLTRDRLGYLEEHVGTSNTISVHSEEAQSIRSLIPNLESEIQVLDKEIAALETKRKARQSRLQRLRVVIAPHKKLPVELWFKIFSYCNNECIRIPFDITPNQAPWSLRHVCSTWRQIALSHQQLWRSVKVLCRYRMECLPDLSDTEPWGSRLHVARQILPPTGPVSIALATQEEGMQLAQADVREGLVELVAHYVTRLQDLSLDCPLWGHAVFLRLPPTFLANVKRLTLDGTVYHDEDPGLGYDGLFVNTGVLSTAENLQALEIRGEADLLEAVVSQRTPWHQLTSLTFEYIFYNRMSNGGPSWAQFLPILRQCTSLVQCSIKLAKAGSQPIPTKAVLPHLRSLSLSTPDAHALDTLTLPSLTYLELAIGEVFPIDELLRLVERSNCSPLSLTDRPIVPQNPIDSRRFNLLLQALSSLTTLNTYSILSNEDIEAIGKAKLLPSLETLSFRSRTTPSEVAEAIQGAYSIWPMPQGECEPRTLITVSTPAVLPGLQNLLDDIRLTPESKAKEVEACSPAQLGPSDIEVCCRRLRAERGVQLTFESHWADALTRRLLD